MRSLPSAKRCLQNGQTLSALARGDSNRRSGLSATAGVQNVSTAWNLAQPFSHERIDMPTLQW